jgi:hypothetical protein
MGALAAVARGWHEEPQLLSCATSRPTRRARSSPPPPTASPRHCRCTGVRRADAQPDRDLVSSAEKRPRVARHRKAGVSTQSTCMSPNTECRASSPVCEQELARDGSRCCCGRWGGVGTRAELTPALRAEGCVSLNRRPNSRGARWPLWCVRRVRRIRWRATRGRAAVALVMFGGRTARAAAGAGDRRGRAPSGHGGDQSPATIRTYLDRAGDRH